MQASRHVLILAILAALAAQSCGAPGGGEPVSEEPPRIAALTEEELAAHRSRRDEGLVTGPDSPIPAAVRADFQGLEYYPFDPDLRFVVRYERHDDPEPLRLVTTEGDVRPAIRAGSVRFEFDGAEHRLQVYELRDAPAESWGQPFLPFMDATTGSETYPAGRYVELAPGPGDWYLLDFNLAYNPLCAYGQGGYQCPRAPVENRLAFPVRAGERGAVTGGAAHSDGGGEGS